MTYISKVSSRSSEKVKTESQKQKAMVSQSGPKSQLVYRPIPLWMKQGLDPFNEGSQYTVMNLCC